MAVELATAYVSIVPSAKGIKERVGRELNLDAQAEKSGRSAGGRISAALGKTLKRSVIGIGVAAGGALGTALFKGWGRLTAIEDAQAKLAGLGHEAKSIRTIMDNALGAVRGTAFGLDEAATVAASTVAAGIKPGQQLQRVLSLVGDTASIAGASMGEMGAIFNKVAASNRLSMSEVNQLANRGVPIIQMLADQYEVTAEEMVKMVSAGKVGFKEFADAIETNIAGAALKSGDTTRGAFANMMAAAGRFGAVLLEGVFPVAQKVFSGLIGWIDLASDAVRPWAEQFADLVLNRVIPAAQQLMSQVGELGARVQEFVSGAQFQDLKAETLERFGSIFATLSQAARDVGPSIATIAESLGRAAASIGISTWQILLTTVDALARVAAAVLVPAIQKLADWMERNQRAVTVLVGSYIAWRVAAWALMTTKAATLGVLGAYRAVTLGVAAASYGAAGATYAQGSALKVFRAIAIATAAKTKILAAAQWLWNAALTANPIGIIVVAIAALVAGIIIAYRNSETFRNIVQAALRAVGAAAMWLWNNAIKPAWDGISAAFKRLAAIVSWWWNNVTKPVFTVVFQVVKSFAALWWWLFTTAISPVVSAISKVIATVGAVLSWLYVNVTRPMFQAIGAMAKWLWEKAIKPAFDGIVRGAKWLYERGIKPAFDGVSRVIKGAWNNVIRPTFDAVSKAVNKIRDTFRKAFRAIGGFISSAFSTAVSTVKGAINGIIDLVNSAVRTINTTVISNANKIPGVNFPSIPSIPRLADGGVVPATPGGRLVTVAEGGQAEAIVPLDRLGDLFGGRPGGPEIMELHVDLGEGIREVVRLKMNQRDRKLKRRVLAGAGATL